MWRLAPLVIPTVIASSALAQAGRSGVYMVRSGDTEIARERYYFEGSVLTDTIDLAGRGLGLASELALNGSGAPTEYQSEVFSLSTGDEIQRLRVLFTRPGAQWTVVDTAVQSGSTPITAPFSMMQNPAFAHLALALLRLDPTSQQVQRLNMWIPEGAMVVELVVIYDSPLKGSANLAGVVMEFEIDEAGWLRQVRIPAQGVVVEWNQHVEIEPDLPFPKGAETISPALDADHVFKRATELCFHNVHLP